MDEPLPAVMPDTAQALSHWIRSHSIPLTLTQAMLPATARALDAFIGDAKVVALGEALHGASEALEWRNQLLRYLVQEKGFTAIALESGVVESRIVHEYVRGADGTLENVMSQGFSWHFDRSPENWELVRWLKDHNRQVAPEAPVNFYGFDLSGSPGESGVERSLDTPLREVLNYLAEVDPKAAEGYRQRVQAFLPFLRFAYDPGNAAMGYESLPSSSRDALTSLLAELTADLQRLEGYYASARSTISYRWARCAASAAEHVDRWVRHIPVGWKAAPEERALLDQAGDIRDRAQADNLEWIVEQEGPYGKVLVFAHNFHISAAPVTRRYWREGAANESREVRAFAHQVAGTYWRERFGSQFVTIGTLIGGKSGLSEHAAQSFESSPSIDAIFQTSGLSSFLLDLRRAPPEIAAALADEWRMGPVFELPQQGRVSLSVRVASAFDAILYVDNPVENPSKEGPSRGPIA